MVILYSLLALWSFQIEARDAFNNVAPGCLERYGHGIDGASFVQVTGFLDVCEVNLSHGVEIRPHGDLVTMKLTVDSGGATPVKVIPTKVSMPSEGDEGVCKVCFQVLLVRYMEVLEISG